MSRSTALTWFALVVLLLEQISPLTPSTAASSATAASIDRSALLREARPVATPVTMTARGHVQRFAGLPARHITWLRQPQPPLRPASSTGQVFLRGRTHHRSSQLLPSVLSPRHPRAFSTRLCPGLRPCHSTATRHMVTARSFTAANSFAVSAHDGTFKRGDVLAAVGGGQIGHYDGAGHLLSTLSTGSSGNYETGMCFDTAGNLYATNFDNGTMSKLDHEGALQEYPWGPSFGNPESCVVDAAGDIYVGDAGSGVVSKLDPTGALLATYQSGDGGQRA